MPTLRIIGEKVYIEHVLYEEKEPFKRTERYTAVIASDPYVRASNGLDMAHSFDGQYALPGGGLVIVKPGPPSFQSREEVPRPKVRKNIQVRWKDGRWEKLLREGWVSA